ncbi:MAG: hypothetical protein ACI8YQ_002965 [Polaribacter sp.]|jgi:hypothetical protein
MFKIQYLNLILEIFIDNGQDVFYGDFFSEKIYSKLEVMMDGGEGKLLEGKMTGVK